MCSIANLHSLNLLRLGDLTEALRWLRQCESLSENNDRCKAITYNNLACYYKTTGQPRSALIYLEKAIELEGSMEDLSFKADTHLNTCAVLSQMGRHDLAMHYAQNAIMIVQASLLMDLLPDKMGATTKGSREKKLQDDIKKDFKERISILAVSYHNLGVEQEFLKMYSEAI